MDFPITESEESDEYEDEVDPAQWDTFSVGSDVASEYAPDEIAGNSASNLVDEEQLREAQGEIEGDFERIVENIKQSNNSNSEGAPVPWTFSIEEGEEFDYDDEVRERSGIGRKKNRKRGPRREVELSHQVRAMIGEASAAFVNQDLSKTMEICQEVIRIEPAAYAAWNTLALVHEERGQIDSALKLKIMAAHLQGDAELWRDLGRESRASGQMQQALYCFRKAVSLDPHDVDALWDRSVILKENNMDRAAMNGFLAILKLVPYHLGVLQQLGPLFSILSEFQKGIRLYQEALAHFQQVFPNGPPDFESADYVILIIALADFGNTVGEHEIAIKAIRDGARWLQGRFDQKYWVTAADDREYDPEGYIRTVASTEEPSSRSQTNYPLDTNLRHRLAIARLALGDIEEGQLHASLVLANDTLEYASLFLEIASAYFERGLYEQALRVYEELAGYDEISTIDILLQIGACHHHLDDLEKSIEVMQYVLQVDSDNNDAKMRLAELYELTDQPKRALQLINEVIASRQSRKDAPVQEDPDAPSNPYDVTNSLFEETKKGHKKYRAKATVQDIEKLENERQSFVDNAFSKLRELVNVDGEDREEWIQHATRLTDHFRETRELFLGNRFSQYRGSVGERRLQKQAHGKNTFNNASDMASRLQLELSTSRAAKAPINSFRRHGFGEWMDLFLQLAFMLTREGKYAIGSEVLRHILYSNAYSDFAAQTTIRTALLACATYAKDYSSVIEHARRLMFTHQFNNDPTRLMLACLGGGMYAVEAFIDTNFQKHLHRDIVTTKLASEGNEAKWVASRNRWAFTTKKHAADDGDGDKSDHGEDSEDQGSDFEQKDSKNQANKSRWSHATAATGADPDPTKATQESPILLAVYGQLSACAKSYQSALFYLFQAYDLQPNDPVICLSLAAASVSRAMQRQVDNRHHVIAQGMGFLQKYRTARLIKGNQHLEEVEYNYGRTFHHLGLLSLAAKHYERVLTLADERLRDIPLKDPGVAKDAAYNLTLIYGITGGAGLAEVVCRKWLSI